MAMKDTLWRFKDRFLWGSKAWDSNRMKIANVPEAHRDESSRRRGFVGFRIGRSSE